MPTECVPGSPNTLTTTTSFYFNLLSLWVIVTGEEVEEVGEGLNGELLYNTIATFRSRFIVYILLGQKVKG